MNAVQLTGRLTRDPEVRYTQGGVCIANFSIAVNRGKDKDGKELVDYPKIVAFNKTGEYIEKYVKKGNLIAITGRIATSSWEKDGKKYFDTQVAAERVESLEKKPEPKEEKPKDEEVLSMFTMVEDDEIPFE